ncbi:MAG: phytanoyl-CoA dioxygenase family protein, partial [Actinomycetota bacterium]
MTTTATTVHPLRDEALRAAFDRDGYVVVDLLPPDVVAELLDVYERLDSGIDTGYYPSLMSSDDAYKAEAHRLVTDLVWPHFGSLLVDFTPLLGVFMVKHGGPDTEVVPHQDWIVAGGSPRPTMNAWAPLTPVDAETGEMRVLPGSHHWLEGLRGSPVFPTQWEAVYERVRDELMVTVPLEVGQA